VKSHWAEVSASMVGEGLVGGGGVGGMFVLLSVRARRGELVGGGEKILCRHEVDLKWREKHC